VSYDVEIGPSYFNSVSFIGLLSTVTCCEFSCK